MNRKNCDFQIHVGKSTSCLVFDKDLKKLKYYPSADKRLQTIALSDVYNLNESYFLSAVEIYCKT